MSCRNTLPSFNSSRQMMTAWKESGLSHRPAIIASRPASIRLAVATSPWRDDVAPNFYPAAIGVWPSSMPCWAVMAAVRGVEPSVERSAADRRAAA